MDGGRVNQKRRTRNAILAAATELVRGGRTVTMPEVAKAAEVSEATAYRYFPDLASLLREAVAGTLFDPAEALAPLAGCADPVARVAAATEHLLRHILTHESAVRAMIAATITRPADTAARPGLRFGLIDSALAPPADLGGLGAPALAQLKRDLAVVMSAEALFGLTDLHGLPAGEAVESIVHTASALTRFALEG
ncbi:TetR/AcrR family transcriptional regulator [Amycolatopsis sp. NBC_01488]|uniref:TetR/AcrR family transcriptional regulator n=1 Tax=Amycolatopsis sp. NBC_01488 TaxID=2903563 RepID=UPI002E289D05|nr:helix-turn-helix domain-containing protein [Amycolatopsis sp. NBC_01488]